MKKIAILILAIFVLALLVIPASAMIGGNEDMEHSNVGAIMMRWTQIADVEPFIGRLCTATLIEERVLVTAAHCYTYYDNQNIGLDEVWVTFDQDPFSKGAKYLAVEEFIPYPNFKVGGSSSSDIALVILEKKPEGIEHHQLPSIGEMDTLLEEFKGKDKPDMQFIVVGYGTSGETTAPDIQLDAERLIGMVTFEKLLEMEIKSSNSKPTDAQLCWGDSGGPLFYKSGQNEILMGVLSRSGMAADCIDEPMFHYRLDTSSAQDFITEYSP